MRPGFAAPAAPLRRRTPQVPTSAGGAGGDTTEVAPGMAVPMVLFALTVNSVIVAPVMLPVPSTRKSPAFQVAPVMSSVSVVDASGRTGAFALAAPATVLSKPATVML